MSKIKRESSALVCFDTTLQREVCTWTLYIYKLQIIIIVVFDCFFQAIKTEISKENNGQNNKKCTVYQN